jgi:hypothetical protein
MSDEQVEAAAQAIHEKDVNPTDWSGASPIQRDFYLRAAHAALTAAGFATLTQRAEAAEATIERLQLHVEMHEERTDAAEAENAKLRDVVEAARKLHKPYTVGVLAWECVNGVCEHDECPEEDKQVCDECWNLWTQDGRDDECFYDGPVMWPCATAAALDRLGDHQ